jgi:hypothetical protein
MGRGSGPLLPAGATECDLTFQGLTDEEIVRLADELAQNTTLTELHLEANKVGAIGAKALGAALEKNSTLQVLNLGDNEVDAEGAAALAAAIEKNSTLEVLSLYRNCVGEAGAISLAAAMGKNTRLGTIELASNKGLIVDKTKTKSNISDDGLDALAAIKDFGKKNYLRHMKHRNHRKVEVTPWDDKWAFPEVPEDEVPEDEVPEDEA